MRLFLVLFTLILYGCIGGSYSSEATTPGSGVREPAKDVGLRMYILDCGYLELPDLSLLGSQGEYAGRAGALTVSCYLLCHPNGDFLWDAGLKDDVSQYAKGQEIDGGGTISVPRTIEAQLATLGMTYQDIEFFAPSHTHFDHVGNTDQLNHAKLLIHKNEYDYLMDVSHDVEPFRFWHEPLREMEYSTFNDELDVFGDGSVVILSAPGHTPGHSVLLVNLAQSGKYLLTGDLYHMNESRERKITPAFNFDREITLESMAQFEAIANEQSAKVIIGHSIEHRKTLPNIPSYLE